MGNAMQNNLLNDSGSSRGDSVQVQVLLPAPSLNSLNLFTVGRMFGLFCFMEDFKAFEKNS